MAQIGSLYIASFQRLSNLIVASELQMTSEGIVTHILFWYEMTLQGDITLSTGARNADNHWRVGAVAVPGPGQLVKKHGSYSVQATFSEQCVDLAFV